ncbi:MAG TPA: plastocyanin/azurin family copper-binding protein [Ktedonobacteraceae bacterium]|jgi:plastocyanin|nr:plastocyanin/azurin family copper-binding protein [Ktedonobacteraceae bacterium]
MHKKVVFGIIGLALLSVLLAACTIRDEASLPTGPSVKMGPSDFIQKTVTIKKGQTLLLVDTAASPHIIVNGEWVGSTQKPAKEAGAPTVNLNFAGNDSKATPPFNTAGTFHIYCTIHGGMNLTITVQ